MITCTFENGNKTSLRHVVIDTIVLRDNKVLMVKRTKKLLEGGKWGIVGGFMDRDETLHETVKREVFEETGWRVKDISLLRIIDRPDRPSEVRQNVSFVFYCTADKKEGEKDWESDEVAWFAFDDLPPKDQIAFDHAENLEIYKQFLKDGVQPELL